MSFEYVPTKKPWNDLCIFQNQTQRVVEPDNTFREKLQTFRKISEPQPEDSAPKGPKPTLSYKTLLGGSNFNSQQPGECEVYVI